MKNISCKMCGSTDVILENGTCTCNTCGTKFSLHNPAATTINDLSDRIKTQGSSDLDSMSVEELVVEARAAFESTLAGSKTYAEACCKKSFAKDSKNYTVLLVYSTVLLDTTTFDFDLLTKLKIIMENCPEDKKSDLRTAMNKSVERALVAYVKEHPTSVRVIQAVNQFEKDYQKTVDPNYSSVRPRALEEVHRGAVKSWNTIQQAYKNAGSHPDQYDWETFVNNGLTNIEMLETAVEELSSGNRNEIPIYEILSSMVTSVMNSCSWTTVLETKTDFATGRKMYRDAWKKEYVLSDTAKEQCRVRLQKYSQKIKELTPPKSPEENARIQQLEMTNKNLRDSIQNETKRLTWAYTKYALLIVVFAVVGIVLWVEACTYTFGILENMHPKVMLFIGLAMCAFSAFLVYKAFRMSGKIKFKIDAAKKQLRENENKINTLGNNRTIVTVRLLETGNDIINCIKIIREVTGLGLSEAKQLADSAPSDIKTAISQQEAIDIKIRLETIGAKVSFE